MDTSIQQCDNCYTTLHGDFCHQCGQEKKSYIRNISGVVTEFFGEFSNWDSRLWRTLLPLWFRPGSLSQRYVRGHRVPYVPPLRMYLFTSIIVFLILPQLVSEPTMGKRTKVSDVAGNNIEQLNRDQADTEEYSLTMPFLEETSQQTLDQQFTAFIENPKLARNKLLSLAPQMMLLLLPVFALLLKLLYIRSDRFYTEHLIVALNSHSFILQVGIFCLLLGALRNHISWAWLVTIVYWIETLFLYWIPVYLLLCQKFYYQQSWLKTLFKFLLTSFLYGFIFVSALIGLILLSVLWM